jgi:hypothetical protein
LRRNQLEQVLRFRFSAHRPEAFATAASHDEEEERRVSHRYKIKRKMKMRGGGNLGAEL